MKASAYFLMLFMTMILLPGSAGRTDAIIAPVPGMVTMVDLGARSCIPCKMMPPIRSELAQAYPGKDAIIFIDVWHDKDAAKRFKVSAIPTQIFFDRHGQEISRHVGFLDKQAIIGRLTLMLEQP